MPVSQEQEAIIVEALRRELRSWGLGPFLHLVTAELPRAREFASEEPASFAEKLVEDVQQDILDLFIDTTWPRCPHHLRHPLWFHDGAWFCDQDKLPIAPLGELPPPPHEEVPWRLTPGAA
jgi:hypothetical protein